VRVEVRLSPPPRLVLSRRVDPSGPVNSSAPRGRVCRGDAGERSAAQARARRVEASVQREQEGPRAGGRRRL